MHLSGKSVILETTKGVVMETTDYGHGITVESDSMSGIVRVNGKIVKKFRGETAWSDAERHATDLMFKVMYA
jgi:hypothetical protein